MKTLRHKIAVMQYAADGGRIVGTHHGTERSVLFDSPELLTFNWGRTDYDPAPDEDGWIPNLGFEPEVPEGKKVQYRHGDGYIDVSSPSDLRWDKLGNIADIVAYRIIDEEPEEPEEPVDAPTKVRVAVWHDRTDGQIVHVVPDGQEHKDLHTYRQWELLGYETKELIDD